jgi:hypothetical protein
MIRHPGTSRLLVLLDAMGPRASLSGRNRASKRDSEFCWPLIGKYRPRVPPSECVPTSPEGCRRRLPRCARARARRRISEIWRNRTDPGGPSESRFALVTCSLLGGCSHESLLQIFRQSQHPVQHPKPHLLARVYRNRVRRQPRHLNGRAGLPVTKSASSRVFRVRLSTQFAGESL